MLLKVVLLDVIIHKFVKLKPDLWIILGLFRSGFRFRPDRKLRYNFDILLAVIFFFFIPRFLMIDFLFIYSNKPTIHSFHRHFRLQLYWFKKKRIDQVFSDVIKSTTTTYDKCKNGVSDSRWERYLIYSCFYEYF
jgi:hypothetical protein